MGWFKQRWKNKPRSTPEKVWVEEGHFLFNISVPRWLVDALGGVCIYILRWVVLEPQGDPSPGPQSLPYSPLHPTPLSLLMAGLPAGIWNTHKLAETFVSSNGRRELHFKFIISESQIGAKEQVMQKLKTSGHWTFGSQLAPMLGPGTFGVAVSSEEKYIISVHHMCSEHVLSHTEKSSFSVRTVFRDKCECVYSDLLHTFFKICTQCKHVCTESQQSNNLNGQNFSPDHKWSLMLMTTSYNIRKYFLNDKMKQHCAMVLKGHSLEPDFPELDHFLAHAIWESYLSSWCLGFFTCKMATMITHWYFVKIIYPILDNKLHK